MNTEKYENTFQFFAGYFNQDWCEEHKSHNPDDVIKEFCNVEPEEFKSAVAYELEQYLYEKPTEAEATRFLLERMGCFYDPTKSGVSVLKWLNHVKIKITTNCLSTNE